MTRCLNCLHCDVCDSDRHEKERIYGDCSDFLSDADFVPMADTINEFADRLIRYYDSLNGGTASGLVAYHVNKIREEMLKKEDNT